MTLAEITARARFKAMFERFHAAAAAAPLGQSSG